MTRRRFHGLAVGLLGLVLLGGAAASTCELTTMEAHR
jgi:hypothetical protein